MGIEYLVFIGIGYNLPTMAETAAWTLREAVPADIEVLAQHRQGMFADMLANQPVVYTRADVEAMELPYRQYLEAHLGTAMHARVIEVEGRVVASGGILVQLWSPRPGDLTGQSALLHSIYVAPEFRRQGFGRVITEALIAACKDMGFKTVSLHASAAGRPLYESLGFHPTTEMRITL